MQTLNVLKATSFSLTFLILAAFLLCGCSASNQTEINAYQCFYDYAISKAGQPTFDARLFWSPDSSSRTKSLTGNRLDVYVSIKKSRLNYAKQDSSFRASYVCTIRLIKNGEDLVTKEFDRTIRQNTYPGLNDNSYDAFLQSFPVESGECRVEVSVSDEESKLKAIKVYQVNIPETSNANSVMGDILFLARYDRLGGGRKITPFILSNVGLLADTISFFTVVAAKAASLDSVSFFLYTLRRDVRNTINMNLQAYVNQQMRYDPCSYGTDTILVYKYSTVAKLNEGYTFIFGAIPKPPIGDYLLKVLARPEAFNETDANDILISKFYFHVYNQGFPGITDDLMEMVNSLNYIAATSEIKKIVEVKTDSAIKANLLNFWKDHGGYDKMARYYQRVGEANRFFTNNCIEGWKTPMGMFYIVCGPPDNVECEGMWDERWAYIQSSAQSSMTIAFRLGKETQNIDDRVYGIENIYSTADLWDYYVNEWRY